MKILSTLALLVTVLSLSITSTEAGQFKLLKTFAATGLEGAGPVGNGAVIGGKLYGFTSSGGAGGKGTFYRINLDGTQFEKLRDFVSGEGKPTSLTFADDGLCVFTLDFTDNAAANYGLLYYNIASGTETLITDKQTVGMRAEFIEGGNIYIVTGVDWSGSDRIVRRKISDNSEQVIHTFTDIDNADARIIDGGGNLIYGITRGGGILGKGTIFKINKDGTGYQQLHSFGGDLWHPDSRTSRTLVLLGGKLYGVMWDGGAPGGPDKWPGGFLYSINTDGTDYRIVKTFYASDLPHNPDCLATDGSLLYIGMDWTVSSGVREGGLVSIKPDGTSLQTLVQFLDASNSPNGKYPDGMIFSGGRLYGWNFEGGAGGVGTVWSYDPGASVNPPPFNGPLYGAVTFGGSVHSVRTSPVTSKTVRGITTTVNATQMMATKLSNTLVLDRARRAGLISSISGYSIVCTDADRQLAFYAYKPGSPLVALEQIISVVEAGVIQAPITTDVYNAALNTTKTSESGMERIYATGRFLGMDVSTRRTLTYKSAQAVINGSNSTYYPGTSTGAFFGTDEAGEEFVEGTFSIAAPKAIQAPLP